MGKILLELDEEEMRTLIEAMDYYHGDLLRKQHPTKDDGRAMKILTKIYNKICLSKQ